MRRVGGNLNRILMTEHLLFEDVRSHFSLPHKTLRDAAAEIDQAGHARAQSYLRQVEHVLHKIKREVVFLFETRARDADRDPTVADARTEYRHTRFVGRRQHAIFRGYLCQFTAEQMQKLTRRISA